MTSPAVRTFLASFLVLFLEIALIRWMPAYVRLLAYFSNFILLASFLGIGVGCLLAAHRAAGERLRPERGAESPSERERGCPPPLAAKLWRPATARSRRSALDGSGAEAEGPATAEKRGAFLARTRLFSLFPLVMALVIGAVYSLRLEVAVPTAGSIYFSSGTSEDVVVVESTMLLPVLFVIVAALFVTLAQQMGREMAALPPLRGYTVNVAGSLAGVVLFGVISWLELPPGVWFGTAFAAALPLVLWPEAGVRARPAPAIAGVLLLGVSLALVHAMARGALWSPYYKVTVGQEGSDTVVEVNNIFHQSMAPLDHKEYFYRWPYEVFGNTFEDVLILGAGSGTDVAAALRHGAKRVDAVEIDPTIIRLGRQYHPDRPYHDGRVRIVNDDARHFLRTTERKYDLVVFALIDSLTMQSSFSGVRLESYMFTEESFRAVRDRLKPDGLLVIYNYFREPWRVDRLANTAAVAFGQEPRVHVHEARAYLGVMLAGPRLAALTSEPVVPERVTAFGQSHAPSPARQHRRDPSIEPATDDWPFLYMRDRHLPRHYGFALALILVVSVLVVSAVLRGQHGRWSWEFFLLGAGFMLLETKSIIQFALLWGSTWVVASLAIAAVLTMALVANWVVSRAEVRRPWLVGGALLGLLALNYAVPIGRIGFESRAVESMFYALLVFSPIFCAGLLFGSAIKRSTSLPRDYGTNLLGAMVGGVGEYLSLLTGFSALLLLIAACYAAAVALRPERSKIAEPYKV